jgi:hypothetical protein
VPCDALVAIECGLAEQHDDLGEVPVLAGVVGVAVAGLGEPDVESLGVGVDAAFDRQLEVDLEWAMCEQVVEALRVRAHGAVTAQVPTLEKLPDPVLSTMMPAP